MRPPVGRTSVSSEAADGTAGVTGGCTGGWTGGVMTAAAASCSRAGSARAGASGPDAVTAGAWIIRGATGIGATVVGCTGGWTGGVVGAEVTGAVVDADGAACTIGSRGVSTTGAATTATATGAGGIATIGGTTSGATAGAKDAATGVGWGAAPFLPGLCGSSGWTSRFNPSRSARRRTRSP